MWKKSTLPGFFLMFLFFCVSRAQPLIHSVSPVDTLIERYKKFEVAIDLTATYTNPYNYDEIGVAATFTSPDGKDYQVDGFFMMEYALEPNGTLIQDESLFKVRFSPNKPGKWTYRIQVSDIQGTTSSASQSFICVAVSDFHNKGFVRTSSSNYLQFDNGDDYIPIGENICWQNANPYMDYKVWLDKLAAEGGNFFRLWHAHWGLGIEWKNGWRNFEGLGNYHQGNARYQDWLFEYCIENGIYVMLCLQHHGPVSTQVNPNWGDSPYNILNGGPCANPWDFFTHPTARNHTKNRFRYILARWGYAKSIMAWELFNEVDWTDNYDQHQVSVMEWQVEMAEYIKDHDPYGHLITTSYAHDQNDPLIWANPLMDITQTHYYVNTPHIERVLVRGGRKYLADYGKPTLSGEFGIGLSNSLSTVDPKGIHIHNGIWGSLFGGGLGTAMSWWWDIYIDPMNMYQQFGPLNTVVQKINFVQHDMKHAEVRVVGAPGDLTLSPTLDWGMIGEDSITIGAGGITFPENPELSIYLYGSLSNTQYKSPPVFIMNYPQSGTFTVKTAATAGFSPRISIYLDGNRVLNQAAKPNSTYTIAVQAGPHTIRVDNTGADWITIAAYTFSGLGSSVDAYVLKSSDQKTAVGWVINNCYNHDEVGNSGSPPSVSGAKVEIDGFQPGNWFVKWYDCLTGAMISSQPVVTSGNKLSLTVPTIYWDLAFIVDDLPGNAASVEKYSSLEFEVFPNPARSGESIFVQAALSYGGKTFVELLNMGGQAVQRHEYKAAEFYKIPVQFNLAPGFYWVRVRQGERSGSRPVVIQH